MALLRISKGSLFGEGEVVIPRETKLPRGFEVMDLVLQRGDASEPVRLLSIVFVPLPVVQVQPGSDRRGPVGVSARSLTQAMTCYISALQILFVHEIQENHHPKRGGEETAMNTKIALVTGGSRGLGKSTVLNLAAQGVDCIFTYLSRGEDALRVAAEVEKLGRKAVCLQLDVAGVAHFKNFSEEVKAALNHHWMVNSFDFLVNNAGAGVNVPFAETTEIQFDQMMNLHLKGVFFLTQVLLPLINDGGRIVNVSSGLTRFSLPGHSAYAAMKGAVEVLTRHLAKELSSRKIAVNTVAPGAIETDFGGGAVRDNEQLNTMIASQTALGRVGLPDDIGAMIALLLSAGNGWINGQRIEVSGGIFL